MKEIALPVKILIVLASLMVAVFISFVSWGIAFTEGIAPPVSIPIGFTFKHLGKLIPLLYVLAGIGCALAWHFAESQKTIKKSLLLFFSGIGVLAIRNFFLLFFGNAFLGMIDILLAVLFLIGAFLKFYPASKWGAILQIPLLLWISYLAFLNVNYVLGMPLFKEEPVAQISEPVTTLSLEKTPPIEIRGQSYAVIRIDSLTWMAENLNLDIGENCWCYENDTTNCQEYGRLYTWEGAKRACREIGWRVPTKEEWDALFDSYGSDISAYKALIEGGNSSFSALLGGEYDYSEEKFNLLENRGSYWCNTEMEAGGSHAWKYGFRTERTGFISRDVYRKEWGFSCRCVRD